MLVWLALLLPSFLVGFGCGFFIKSKWGWVLSALLPWLAFLIILLGTVYLIPNEDKDASMWPIAQFFGGTISAFMGLLGCWLVRKLTKK